MNAPLFRANKKQMLGEWTEIETEPASESSEWRVLVLATTIGCGRGHLELHQFLGLELVLHEKPIRHPPVGRDTAEGERPSGVVLVPPHFPHWVRVLRGPHRAGVHCFF